MTNIHKKWWQLLSPKLRYVRWGLWVASAGCFVGLYVYAAAHPSAIAHSSIQFIIRDFSVP